MIHENFPQESVFDTIADETYSTSSGLPAATPNINSRPESQRESSLTQSNSRRSATLRRIGWILLAVTSFLLFTLLKTPTERIESAITTQVTEAVQNAGYNMTAARAHVRMGWGVTYELEEVSLTSSGPQTSGLPAKIQRISLRPSLFSYAIGRLAGNATLVQSEGATLEASFSTPDSSRTKTGATHLQIKLENLEIPRLIPSEPTSPLSKLQLKTSGTLEFSGAMEDPTTWGGEVEISAPSVRLEDSVVMSMPIPGLKVSNLSLKGKMDPGTKKLILQEFLLGKTGGNEDLTATLTGDIQMTPSWRMNPLNLTAKYRIQGELQKRLGAILMLLDKFKKPDGSYVTQIKGTLSSPQTQ